MKYGRILTAITPAGIAVFETIDGVAQGKVFTLQRGEKKEVRWRDEEENEWYKTTVSLSDDLKNVNCEDSDGFIWISPIKELLDNNLVLF